MSQCPSVPTSHAHEFRHFRRIFKDRPRAVKTRVEQYPIDATGLQGLFEVHHHQAGEDLDAVPEVLDADVLVFGVLVIVVIGDGG